jgi:hypothetical protein
MKTKCKRCINLDGNCKIIEEYLPKLNKQGFLQLVDSELYCCNFIDNKDYFTNEQLESTYKRMLEVIKTI